MKNKLLNKTRGDMALDYIAKAVNILEGESPEHAKSFVVTISGDDDSHVMDIFQYDDNATPDAVKKHLIDETCGDWTEDVTLDE